MDNELKVTTTISFDGYRVKEYKGIVRGIIVRSPTIAQGILVDSNQSLADKLDHTPRCVGAGGNKPLICV